MLPTGAAAAGGRERRTGATGGPAYWLTVTFPLIGRQWPNAAGGDMPGPERVAAAPGRARPQRTPLPQLVEQASDGIVLTDAGAADGHGELGPGRPFRPLRRGVAAIAPRRSAGAGTVGGAAAAASTTCGPGQSVVDRAQGAGATTAATSRRRSARAWSRPGPFRPSCGTCRRDTRRSRRCGRARSASGCSTSTCRWPTSRSPRAGRS